MKKWLARYKEKKIEVLRLGAALGVADREFAIEDIFDDGFYLDRVAAAYKKELAAHGGRSALVLQGSDQLCKRVERTFDAVGLTFGKGRVAKQLRAELSRMRGIGDLPPVTAAHARKLMAAISAALPVTDDR